MDHTTLLQNYIEHVLEHMDIKDLVAYVRDDLEHSLGNLSTTDLITEVERFAPDLLEQEPCA
jgi:hypothetical protein